MHIRKRGGQWRGLTAARALSEVRSNAVLLSIMPVYGRGGQRNILVVEAEAKSEVGANREEVK